MTAVPAAAITAAVQAKRSLEFRGRSTPRPDGARGFTDDEMAAAMLEAALPHFAVAADQQIAQLQARVAELDSFAADAGDAAAVAEHAVSERDERIGQLEQLATEALAMIAGSTRHMTPAGASLARVQLDRWRTILARPGPSPDTTEGTPA